MKFYSTKNKSSDVDFQTALVTGIPKDNGLYMPEYMPDLSKVFNQKNQLTFQELSLLIASKFILSPADILAESPAISISG